MKWRRRRFQRARKKAREATWKTFRAPASALHKQGHDTSEAWFEAALAAQNDRLQGPFYGS
jgi:hypothetical protein